MSATGDARCRVASIAVEVRALFGSRAATGAGRDQCRQHLIENTKSRFALCSRAPQ
jgi:hypothetical protein